MIEVLRKMFEANPEKSIIVLKGKCSECGCDVNINITSTSGGFGLQGGALLDCSCDGYIAKCTNCYKLNPIIEDRYKQKFVHVY